MKDESYDVLEELHVRKLYKRFPQHYFGVTEKQCKIYVKLCPTCNVVTKPIVSENYLSRGHFDLIDFNDMNLVENMSPDGVTP